MIKYLRQVGFIFFISISSSCAFFNLDEYTDSDSYVSFLEDIQKSFSLDIPGLGAINLTCSVPSFKLDYEKFDLCTMQDKLFEQISEKTGGFDFSSLGSFSFGDNNCGFSVKLNANSCQKFDTKKWCEDENKEVASLLSLQKLKSGIGGFDVLSSKKLSLYGGKEIFGEKTCGNDPKRTKAWETDTMKAVYGKDSLFESTWSSKLLDDTSIGGSAIYLNTRKGKAFLRCIEIAEKEGIEKEECYLNSARVISDFNATEISKTVKITAARTVPQNTASPGGLSTNAASFFPLFVKYSKEFGINNPKILLAVAMQESGGHLNVNAKNSNKNSSGEVSSTDWGLMQINDKAQKENWKKLYPDAGFIGDALRVNRSGRGAIDRSIRMGALVLSKCMERFGQDSWNAVDCYNKGAGGAQKNIKQGYSGFQNYGGGMAYINGVKKWFAKIGGMNMDGLSGNNGSLYAVETTTTQSIALFATIAEIATERTRTLTHVGQDIIDDRIPEEKKMAYIQMTNRWMAQKTFIEAGNKRVAELAKTMLETFAFGAEIQSQGAGDESNNSKEEEK